jgi:hypothetical protein
MQTKIQLPDQERNQGGRETDMTKTVRKIFRLPIRSLQILFRIQNPNFMAEIAINMTKTIIEAIENYGERAAAINRSFKIPKECSSYGWRKGSQIYCNKRGRLVDFPYACISCSDT